MSELRSRRWFGGNEISGFIHRASIHAEGISRSALAGRPVIGVSATRGRSSSTATCTFEAWRRRCGAAC